MARLRALSAVQVLEILEQHGFVRARQRGSHLAMQRREGDTTLTVIVPMHRELRTGTLLSILRQSKLDRSLFER